MTTVLRSAGGPPDLGTVGRVLTRQRSYPGNSSERMEQTVHTLDAISRALAGTVGGPRSLVEDVLRAAATHLRTEWMLLALADGALPDARPRFLALGPDGALRSRLSSLPADQRRLVRQVRERLDDVGLAEDAGWVRIAMMLDGTAVGALAGQHRLPDGLQPTDLSALRILANQAAVSVHTVSLYQSGLALRRRAQVLYDELSARARDLSARTEELRSAELRLQAAGQRELLDAERHRIALELHDSVAQTVLSAGIAVDLCRADVAALPGGAEAAARLGAAEDALKLASEQLRSVIYALHHSRTADDLASLPELLQEMAAQHQPQLGVAVRVEGRPVPLGSEAEQALARTAGEALFNVALHAGATRAQLRLRYGAEDVTLSVSDDGTGDPTSMRRMLRLSRIHPADGRHRGLAGMASRAAHHGGELAIRRARLGGVTVRVRLPLPSRPKLSNRDPDEQVSEPTRETA